jgi:hypothetical protein
VLTKPTSILLSSSTCLPSTPHPPVTQSPKSNTAALYLLPTSKTLSRSFLSRSNPQTNHNLNNSQGQRKAKARETEGPSSTETNGTLHQTIPSIGLSHLITTLLSFSNPQLLPPPSPPSPPPHSFASFIAPFLLLSSAQFVDPSKIFHPAEEDTV